MSKYDDHLQPPDNPAGPCSVCGGDVDAGLCICPECDECGEAGNPECYEKHGMIRSDAQIAQYDQYLEYAQAEEVDDTLATEAYWAAMEEDYKNGLV